jgi:ribosomal protein S18 acetylase RimI-like enzyme
MDNYTFLKKYSRLQYGIMFNKLENLGFGVLTWCKRDKSPYWNLIIVNREVSKKQLERIEKRFYKLGRNPTVYFENRPNLSPLVSLLDKSDYDRSFEDSWMFFTEHSVDKSKFTSVKKVGGEDELQVFLKTFNQCYQKNDPQNPYGELGDYLEVAGKVWNKHNKGSRLEYFVVFKDSKPVAVSTLTNFDGIGYISNVGSLRSVRGEGFGKAATMYCIWKSRENGNTMHCLATEEGNYPNQFYKRIGFKTKFSAVAYSKKK